MTRIDHDLGLLLVAEIDKRLARIEMPGSSDAELRAALHSLRGSAALAGESDLALVLAHMSARIRAGEPDVRGDVIDLLSHVRARLSAGERAFADGWPAPPRGLGAPKIDPRYRREYLAAVADRLAELDVIEQLPDARALLEEAYRVVHALKGAAGSVGDDLTAWYCHGLETRLKQVLASGNDSAEAAGEIGRHRALIARLIEEPERALESLRALSPRSRSAVPSAPASKPPRLELDEEPQAEAPLRVPGAAIERLIERLERIDVGYGELSITADGARKLALRLREVRSELIDALRAIGPSRPWGAPAAALAQIEAAARVLGSAADNADHGAVTCRRSATTLHAHVREMRNEIASLRRSTLGWLFSRIARGVERMAQREGRQVLVDVRSADVPLDRGLAERLIDPLAQLAQNAVAHGIEPPEERARAGKPVVGTITLRAERLGDWLRIVVEDDGRGADVERIRRLAVSRGALTAEAAESASGDELLALLFLPGLTTREDADLLAGRGVGLDLARDAVRRVGGAMRLKSRPGSGLSATIELPSERGLVDVLWIEAAGLELALPVSFTGKLERASTARPSVHLARCLGLPAARPAALALDVVISGVDPIAVGIDAVRGVEEASVRAIPPLIAAAGPYSGAILRGDGSLRLALDPALIAARAWASLG